MLTFNDLPALHFPARFDRGYYRRRNQARALHGKRCYLCGRALSLRRTTYDHVDPLCQGGADTVENLRPCCQPCNVLKGQLSLDEFHARYPAHAAIMASDPRPAPRVRPNNHGNL